MTTLRTLFCLHCREPRLCRVFADDEAQRLCLACGWQSARLVGNASTDEHNMMLWIATQKPIEVARLVLQLRARVRELERQQPTIETQPPTAAEG